jgi:hypothetical protein
VTLSLAASTQVLAFDLVPERTYTWRLPAGELAVPHASNPNADVERRLSEAFVLELHGPARVTLEMTSRGQLAMNVVPPTAEPDANALTAMVRTAAARLDLAEFAELAFLSTDAAGFLRIPLIASHVTLGELPTDTTATTDLDVPYQPILLGGDMQFFARSGSGSHRYLVLDGRVDPADVVTIDADAVAEESAVAWLMLTFLGTTQADNPAHIDVRLHASTPRVRVTRLHSPEGYSFGVTPWQILSTRPSVQYAWVSLASLILLLGFTMNVTNFVSTQRATAMPQSKKAEPLDDSG